MKPHGRRLSSYTYYYYLDSERQTMHNFDVKSKLAFIKLENSYCRGRLNLAFAKDVARVHSYFIDVLKKTRHSQLCNKGNSQKNIFLKLQNGSRKSKIGGA